MMNKYDIKCLEEFKILEAKIDRFFINDETPCPYKLPFTANFHQAMFGPLNERIMELFLSRGFRRNGNSLYEMHCEHCSQCISIRLQVDEFKPNRNQKRVVKKNSDLQVSVGPLVIDQERLELCDLFLQSRYPNRKNVAHGYYSFFFLNDLVNSFEIQYRLGKKLVGIGIIDLGLNWLNGVYFYFDPEYAERSPGTFNILKMVELCRARDVEYLYLGYTIPEVAAMNYKERFFPHYLLVDDHWEKCEKGK